MSQQAHRPLTRRPAFWVAIVLVALAIVALVTLPYRHANEEMVPSPPVASP